MEQRPRNKFVIILLALSVLAFLSISIIPLISGLLSPPVASDSSANPSPNVAANADVKQLEEQERGYQSVVEREPTNENALRGLFETRTKLIQLGQRQPKDLIDPLEKLKANNPEVGEIAVLLAQTYQQSGDREAAAKTYREVLDKSPGEIKALQGLVALFVQENQSSSAVELLKNTLASGESGLDVAAIQLLLGDVYTAQRNYDEALDVYEALIQKEATDFRPLVGKALVLRAQGKTAEAKTWFDQAKALAPAQFKDRIAQLATEDGPASSQTAPVDRP